MSLERVTPNLARQRPRLAAGHAVLALLVTTALTSDTSWAKPAGPKPQDVVLDLPDVFGPGAVLRAGNVHMKVTNWGHIGNISTNLSTDPAGQWPGESGVEYLNSIRLAVGAKDPLESDPAKMRRVSYLFNWRPATLEPVDRIYEAQEGVINGTRFVNDDADRDVLTDTPKIDEDFLDGRDNDGDGLIDEDFGALGQQMFSLVMNDHSAEAVAADSTYLPLGLECQQLAWAYAAPGLADFNVVEYTIRNRSGHALDSLYIGWAVDLDCGPVNHPDYYQDDLDLPGFPSGDFRIQVPNADPQRQFPHSPLVFEVSPDSALCPVDTLRVRGFAVADPDRDGGLTPGVAAFLLVEHTIDPIGVSAPAQVGFRAFRSFLGGTPFGAGGNPSNSSERYQFMSGTENVDPATGIITAAPGATAGDYVQWCSIGPFLNVADGASIRATIAFAVKEGTHAASLAYPADYASYRNGTLSGPALLAAYPLAALALKVQKTYDGIHELREGFPVPDFHGRETALQLPPGAPPQFVADCRDAANGSARPVTDHEPTWFDFDCSYCTGIWDATLQRGLFHHTWEAPDGSTRVLANLERADAEPNRVTLVWRIDSPVLRAMLERSNGNGAWRSLGALASDGRDRWSYEDRDVVPGERYTYRLGIEAGGALVWLDPIWVDIPRSPSLALRSLQPNPIGKYLVAQFRLASAAPARLEIFDAAGRSLRAVDVRGMSPGEHSLDLGSAGRLKPGVYCMRLTQAGQSALQRFVVLP